jgi:N-hydroxyarylamine O-acetyltransferase
MAPGFACAFDLEAYLQRIRYAGDRTPTAAVLAALHEAHALSIPFENLDIHFGRPIRLDLASLQAKLVRQRRGGYCFEQNTLFAAALEALGFAVIRLAARVRLGTPQLRPRTHMLLGVEVEGASWVADVGFGGDGLLRPLPLRAGSVVRSRGNSHRLIPEGQAWVLQASQGGVWQDQYVFTLEPHHDVDFEMANHYTSTHPSSHFVQTFTVQLPIGEARYILRGRELTVTRAEDVSRRTITDDADLLNLLAEVFGLELPPGTRLPQGP